ncbi:MAG: PilZ domain-containing protein [Thermoanaerobaculia bacterium]
MAGDERRIFRRFPRKLEVQYVLAGAQHTGLTNDVSLTGFFVHAQVLPEAGQTLTIRVTLPDGRSVKLEVRAVRSQSLRAGATGTAATAAAASTMPSGFGANILKLDETFVGFLNDLENPDGELRGLEPVVSASGTFARLSETSCFKMNAPVESVPDRGVVRVLVADEEEAAYADLRTAIAGAEAGSYTLEWARTAPEALSALIRKSHDVCVLQSEMTASSGLDLFRQARAAGSDALFILLVPARDRALETLALEAGVADVLDLVSLDANVLERSIRYAILRASAARRTARAGEMDRA